MRREEGRKPGRFLAVPDFFFLGKPWEKAGRARGSVLSDGLSDGNNSPFYSGPCFLSSILFWLKIAPFCGTSPH
ncbi:hypothetical protein CEXT_74661 [Caerostris extrusa]|uniref:Uncharacterized protein n=1 Tax=Caerostris extrusa TaxID=172846 RepID=A0AAV4T7R6_CAEEX|nr:hypothetical protein CEXT_74661 [Caerostris extrusa]